MKLLFRAADRYIEESDWKALAVLKFCLMSLGVLLGCKVPERRKAPVVLGAGAAFFVTYIPLMAKLFRTFAKVLDEAKEETNP